MGKTTLFDKVAYDWATGASDALRKYKLVFLLKMRSLKKDSDLINALFDQFIDSKDLGKEDLKSFITANSDKVLLLLDGFDEFETTEQDEKFGSLLMMLKRSGEYKDCWAIVTTRPSGFDMLTKLIERPFTHVNVLGSSKVDIKT